MCLPVPGLESVAGPFKQIALHHHAVGRVHVELHLWVVIGEVLERTIAACEKHHIVQASQQSHKERRAFPLQLDHRHMPAHADGIIKDCVTMQKRHVPLHVCKDAPCCPAVWGISWLSRCEHDTCSYINRKSRMGLVFGALWVTQIYFKIKACPSLDWVLAVKSLKWS